MTPAEQSFHGDRPIEAPSEDRLGFGPAARHVAEAIHKMASPDGFVIGIEGEWGSGKSSFINLVSDALRKPGSASEIVRFLPWLISSREGLLKELFTEITKAALRIDAGDVQVHGWKKLRGHIWPSRYSAQALRKRKIKGLFSRFSSRLVQAGKLAELLGLSGAGTAMEAGKRAAEEWLGNTSLEKEKAQIQEELRRLERKIVVFVDDLDRLEPNEVVEVLRLVRAVVDFPNVIYVLCYSRDIIAKNLSTALHIEKGEEFLEKIVQVSFSVPRPEAFDLRRMFRHDLQLLYPELLEGDGAHSRALMERLAHVIDIEGGRALLTPRHVVRAVNALRFHATPVLENIDVPDMVWLQLIRLQSERLYEWVGGYLIGFAAKHAGARISDEGKKAELQQLNSILDGLPGIDSNRESRMLVLTELPGIEFDFERQADQQKFKMVLSLYGREDVSSQIRGKRLGSPQHFRYYFSLTAPQGAIHDREYAGFIENARDCPEVAVRQFSELVASLNPQGKSSVQALLDRLKGDAINDVPDEAIPGILASLAEGMDVAALKTGRGDWGEYWVWRDADKVFEGLWGRLRQSLSESDRNALLKQLFGDGRAIGWLTGLFRSEIFGHGIYGSEAKPENERTFSRDELDVVAQQLLRRYRELTAKDLPHLPKVAHVLYSWKQYSPDSIDEIKKKVGEICGSDSGFLNLLQGMRGWQATNGVVSYPLKMSSLSRFMDVEQVKARLESLVDVADRRVADSAKDLLAALRAGDDE